MDDGRGEWLQRTRDYDRRSSLACADELTFMSTQMKSLTKQQSRDRKGTLPYGRGSDRMLTVAPC
jgi:hypothetical protein